MTIECPNCQFENPIDTAFCGKCGRKFEIDKGPTKTLETPTEELTRGSLFAGRYEIIEELGKGGMGRVYRVFDKKGDLKRFIRRSKQLGIGTALSIAKQICDGLVEAHRLDVVHRDLKPNNIMIDDHGNTRIMDFGIARSLSEKGITGKGVMIGTPEYMSPEQVEGKEVDQRSDIYSLGIILYEMVTGRVPFEGDTPFVIGVKHKSEKPKEPKDFNPQIPDDLNQVILKCLEKEKESRYHNTGEILSVLNQIEQGIPTTERSFPKSKPITSKEITVRFTPKRFFIPAASILILAVVAFFVFKRPAADLNPRRIAVLSFVDQTGDESLEGIGEILAHSIATHLWQIEDIEDIEVVPTATVNQISTALGTTENEMEGFSNIPRLARETGAGTVISGICYLENDILNFQAQVTDTKQGQLLMTIPKVSGC